jgi:hypothetical protein
MQKVTTNVPDRFRPRAQSLFEYRPRINTDWTANLVERLLVSLDSTNCSNEATIASDTCVLVTHNHLQRTIFFIGQPLVASLLIFPLLIIFWQAGWNFMDKWLNTSHGEHWTIVVLIYILAQCIFLCIYLNQDHFYDYVRQQKYPFLVRFILQTYTLIISSSYILQWVSMWTICDRYTSQDWRLMLMMSLVSVLVMICLMGHSCDLVCAPFILSYDSIEYNIRIGSPFLTDKVTDTEH